MQFIVSESTHSSALLVSRPAVRKQESVRSNSFQFLRLLNFIHQLYGHAIEDGNGRCLREHNRERRNQFLDKLGGHDLVCTIICAKRVFSTRQNR